MNSSTRSFIICFIGFIFLIFGVAAVINTTFNLKAGLAPILWFSYIGLIVLAIGCFRRDSSLIASQLCIIFIPYIIWNIDFFTYLFNGSSLWGTADYFFRPGNVVGKIITIQHLFNLPLSLFTLYLIGLKRKDFWKISAFEVTFLFFVTRFVTDYKQNVNCVYHNCANFSFGLWYPLEWFLTYAVIIAVTNWLLIKLYK